MCVFPRVLYAPPSLGSSHLRLCMHVLCLFRYQHPKAPWEPCGPKPVLVSYPLTNLDILHSHRRECFQQILQRIILPQLSSNTCSCVSTSHCSFNSCLLHPLSLTAVHLQRRFQQFVKPSLHGLDLVILCNTPVLSLSFTLCVNQT